MKTKELIAKQLVSYEKSYQETKNFEEFKTNIYNVLLEIESITPVTPFYSSYLFHAKLDYENMDRMNAMGVSLSLKSFLDKLEI